MQIISNAYRSKSSSSDTRFKVPFLRPPFDYGEIAACIDVLKTADISSGSEVKALEDRFRLMTRMPFAYAVNSGTTALEMVLGAFVRWGELAAGDQVIIPSFTFAAVANAVVNAGLKPCFADIDPRTWNIDFSRIQATREKAVIVTHTFGNPVDIEAASSLAADNGMILIEDCAEACGARWGSDSVGSLGDAATFSFNATKNMTTGEGGMICTPHPLLSAEISLRREHGIVALGYGARETVCPGHNYRLSNILAAIGVEQFDRLEANNDRRRAIAAMYREELAGLPVTFQEVERDCTHAYQLLTVRVPAERRDPLYMWLRDCGVEAKIYFNPPIHRQAFYLNKKWGCCTDCLVETEKAALDCISLPMYPSLTDNEVRQVAAIVAEVLR